MRIALFCDYTQSMMDTLEPARHERGPRGNSLAYPAFSRRAGGISVGINLFPTRKECSFDCPYCEVLPFPPGDAFSLRALAEGLEELLLSLSRDPETKNRIKDICFSGNGEPTLSPYLPEALDLAAEVRRKTGFDAAELPVRIITNSTGFLKKEINTFLASFHEREGLSVWAKLDAGTQAWFQAISGTGLDIEVVTNALIEFSRIVPVTIQTMLCRIGYAAPDLSEARRYAARIQQMAHAGAMIEQLHFYTVSRPPKDSRALPFSDEAILAFMREASDWLEPAIPMSGFGAASARPLELA